LKNKFKNTKKISNQILTFSARQRVHTSIYFLYLKIPTSSLIFSCVSCCVFFSFLHFIFLMDDQLRFGAPFVPGLGPGLSTGLSPSFGSSLGLAILGHDEEEMQDFSDYVTQTAPTSTPSTLTAPTFSQVNNNDEKCSTGEFTKEVNSQFPNFLRCFLPHIHNVVSTIDVGCPLNLQTVAIGARNAEYNPKRFSGVILRIRDPKTTALIFSTGKIICAGAKSESDAILAMKKFVFILKKLGFQQAKLNDFHVRNVVGCSDVRFPIQLELFAATYPDYCCYEPELFPGLVFRMLNPRVSAIVFVSGKVVFTGGRTRDDLKEAFLNIYPILVEFCKENYKDAVLRRGPPPPNPSFMKSV
jgi:transcription initiation factor TFIID TATA-box-binding protein